MGTQVFQSNKYIQYSLYWALYFLRKELHNYNPSWESEMEKRTPWKVGMLCVFLDFLIEIPFAKSIDLVIVFQMS